jgi:hypothetical protein
MKKTLVLACLVSAFAVSGFAQSVPAGSATAPAQAGAKRVAERDAEWSKAHPTGTAAAQAPVARKVKTKQAHSAKVGKHGKRVKSSKHAKHSKPGKHVKHVKPGTHKVKKAV